MDVKLTRFEEDLIKKGNPQGAFDSMLSRFNSLVQASGLFRELKEREVYHKPSIARSKKRQVKLAKCRKETREYALRKERIQREGGWGSKRPSDKTKTDKGRGFRRSDELHNHKNGG